MTRDELLKSPSLSIHLGCNSGGRDEEGPTSSSEVRVLRSPAACPGRHAAADVLLQDS